MGLNGVNTDHFKLLMAGFQLLSTNLQHVLRQDLGRTHLAIVHQGISIFKKKMGKFPGLGTHNAVSVNNVSLDMTSADYKTKGLRMLLSYS